MPMNWNFPVTMMIYCNKCQKLFDIIVAGQGSRNYSCPACGKVQVFVLDDFADKAVEQSRKMMRRTLE